MSAAAQSARSIFGFTVSSDFRFETLLLHSDRPPDLSFTCAHTAPGDVAAFAFDSPAIGLGRLPDGQPFMTVHMGFDCDVIRYTEVADFYVQAERIICHVLDPEYSYALEIYLLGFVLAYWLERFRDIPALHAAAAVVEGRGVGFLSTNKGGKSSLAASLMQAGHHLLTDDILPLEQRNGAILGRPGYPQMRMWPDQTEHFLGSHEKLELVHPELSKRRIPVGPGGFGSFYNAPVELVCLYVPERRDPAESEAIEITPLPAGEALMTAVRHSFLAEVLTAVGLEARRLGFFAKLVPIVPVRTLAYPSGVEYLPLVREAILSDVFELGR